MPQGGDTVQGDGDNIKRASKASDTASEAEKMTSPEAGAASTIADAVADAVRGAIPRVSVEQPIHWSDMDVYPMRSDRVDAWFILFETKMKAARVPRQKWASKLMECSRLGAEMKRRLTEQPDERSAYADLRAFCLRLHGPVEPIGFYRSKIWSVKGGNAQDVLAKLEDALVLHNRACLDAKREVWSDKDLLYPFVLAFPPEVSAKLRRHLASVVQIEHPLQQLAHRAPTKADADEALQKLVASVEETDSKTAHLAAAVANLQQRLEQAQFQPRHTGMKRQRTAQCSRCGGTCISSANCPAMGKTCSNCKRLNHFARVCRSKAAPPGDPPKLAPNPPQRAMNFDANQNFQRGPAAKKQFHQ